MNFDEHFDKEFNRILVLTSLSVRRSTLQCKKPVWPTVTVIFLETSKSKYGSRLAGETVVDVADRSIGVYAVTVSVKI